MKHVLHWIGTGALATALALVLTLGVVGSPMSTAEALPIQGWSAKGCYYDGKYYSDGSIVKQANGYYKCTNGSWKFHSSAIRPLRLF